MGKAAVKRPGLVSCEPLVPVSIVKNAQDNKGKKSIEKQEKQKVLVIESDASAF